jgi:hypothetical protein
MRNNAELIKLQRELKKSKRMILVDSQDFEVEKNHNYK